MPRRGDPERIYQARRAATFAILTQTRAIDELDAEHWMVRWEREDPLMVLPQFAAAPARRRKALVNATGLAYRASGGRAIGPLPKRGGVPGQGAFYLTNLSPIEETEDA